MFIIKDQTIYTKMYSTIYIYIVHQTCFQKKNVKVNELKIINRYQYIT